MDSEARAVADSEVRAGVVDGALPSGRPLTLPRDEGARCGATSGHVSVSTTPPWGRASWRQSALSALPLRQQPVFFLPSLSML